MMRHRVLVLWAFAVLLSTTLFCRAELAQTQEEYEAQVENQWEQEKRERKQKNQQLLKTVQNGDVKQVAQALKYPLINVHVRDAKGTPVIMIAVANGRADIVSLLVNHRAWVYYNGNKFAHLGDDFETGTDARGKSALTLAVEKGNSQVLQLVRDAALIETCGLVDFSAAKKLIAQGANVNGNKQLTQLPLTAALEGSDNYTDYENEGQRQEQKIKLIRFLLQKGAKSTADNLRLAAMDLPPEVFDLLLLKGANAKARFSSEQNITLPMYFVDAYWKQPSDRLFVVVERLLNAGADVNAQDAQGRTLLMRVLDARRNRLMKLFLQRGAKINLRDQNGQTALHWAAKMRSVDVVKILLQRGANVNQRTLRGDTPLLLAVGELRVEESSKGDIFTDGSDTGAPALSTVKILLRAGAKVSAKDAQGRTALDVARLKLKNGRFKKDYAAIVALLKPSTSSTRSVR